MKKPMSFPSLFRRRPLLAWSLCFYLPVALVALLTTVGFQVLTRTTSLPIDAPVKYLYVLCGEVLLAAFYLFKTYWTAMRNMMYANR